MSHYSLVHMNRWGKSAFKIFEMRTNLSKVRTKRKLYAHNTRDGQYLLMLTKQKMYAHKESTENNNQFSTIYKIPV